MKALNSIKVIAISAVASLILAGCGGGSGSGNSVTGATTGNSVVGTTISGVAIDPEIQGANVYLDANENGKYDVGELNTTTDNLGRYSLTIPEADVGKPCIVEGGIDRVTKADFKGRLKLLTRATKEDQFITPLTTMVVEARDNNPERPLSEIRDELATKLGLASTDDLDKDTLKNKNLLKIALRIQRIAQKVSDVSGKDISQIYRRIAGRLASVDFDRAIKDTIDADINETSLDHSRALDLDREIKNIDDDALSAEGLALTVDNIDINITATKTKQELDIDIYNKTIIIVHNEKEAKELKERKVLDRLGFKDLSDALKQRIINNAKLDFKDGLISDIKDKIEKNSIGLDKKDLKEIDREKLFKQAGLKDMRFDLKEKLREKFDSEDFDFKKASLGDFEKKIGDANFLSGMSKELVDELSSTMPEEMSDSEISIGTTPANGDSSTADSASETSTGSSTSVGVSTSNDADSETSTDTSTSTDASTNTI